MHAQYKRVKEQLVQLFEGRTIGQLAKDLTEGKAFLVNARRQRRKQ